MQDCKTQDGHIGEANPLTGYLYCSDCGRRLYNHRAKACQTTDKRNGKTITKKAKNIYTCPTYYIHHNDCSMHYISSESVGKLILETIKRATVYARNNEAEFIRIIREASNIKQNEAAKSHKRQITKNEKRITELDALFKKTYEDLSKGLLNENRFKQLSGGYETEQAFLTDQTITLKAELEQFDNDGLRADKFLELANRYTDITELTAPLLHIFIEKVIVHEADRSNGKREQQVDIYLNFIGQFETPKEAEQDDISESDKKRAQWRQYKRNAREKAKCGKDKQNKTKQEKTKQANSAKQGKTKQGKTKQDKLKQTA